MKSETKIFYESIFQSTPVIESFVNFITFDKSIVQVDSQFQVVLEKARLVFKDGEKFLFALNKDQCESQIVSIL